MTTTAYNVDNAPRDPAELAKIGRFNLRTVAIGLGLMETEQQKAQFMTLDNNGMVAAISPLLLEYDKAKGGGKAQTSKPATAPVRTPVTSQTAAAASAAPAGQTAQAAGAQVGIVELVRALEAVKLSHSETAQAMQGRFDAVDGELGTIRTILKGTNRLLLTSMALNLFLAEEVLKADRASIIKTAHGDVEGLVAVLTELGTDVPNDDEEEESEDGEAEEGKG